MEGKIDFSRNNIVFASWHILLPILSFILDRNVAVANIVMGEH